MHLTAKPTEPEKRLGAERLSCGLIVSISQPWSQQRLKKRMNLRQKQSVIDYEGNKKKWNWENDTGNKKIDKRPKKYCCVHFASY